jgi:hypothetical protein
MRDHGIGQILWWAGTEVQSHDQQQKATYKPERLPVSSHVHHSGASAREQNGGINSLGVDVIPQLLYRRCLSFTRFVPPLCDACRSRLQYNALTKCPHELQYVGQVFLRNSINLVDNARSVCGVGRNSSSLSLTIDTIL